MKKYTEIIQGTEEWQILRHGKIGGSTSKELFVSSNTLLYQILSETIEPYVFEETYTTDAMDRGVELEPFARKNLSQYIGVELQQCGWLECEEIPILGISPDGISEDETISAEIKCPQAKKHTQTICEGEIPLDNIHQCLHYFTVNPKLKKHYFCSFRPENKLKPMFVKELTRETLINVGTKAKPVVKPVFEWVAIAKKNAIELQENIKKEIEKLKF